jgi:hypothetical protein
VPSTGRPASSLRAGTARPAPYASVEARLHPHEVSKRLQVEEKRVLDVENWLSDGVEPSL